MEDLNVIQGMLPFLMPVVLIELILKRAVDEHRHKRKGKDKG